MKAMPFFAMISVVVLMLTGCHQGQDVSKKEPAPLTVAKGVVVAMVKSSTLPETLEVVGTVHARTSAVVSVRVPGAISFLRASEGDRVKKGQLLAQLNAEENQATAAVATAGIEDARRSLSEAETRKRLADATFERYQKLFNEQVISRQEFDIKQAEIELASAGVAGAQIRLKQAQAGARAASTLADYTRIVAPISGVITGKFVDFGSTVFPSQPIVTIEDEDSLYLEFLLPESLASEVKPGSPVQVTLDAFHSVFAAKITEVVPAADPGSHTFAAKVNLSQQDRQGLKSGMFVRGIIGLGTSESVMTLPVKALMERGSLKTVWVVDKDRLVRLRLVKTGKVFADRVGILSGLSEGELVIVSGVDKATEGERVE